MDRGRTEREYSGYAWGSSPVCVVLLMTLLTVLSNGYVAISRCNMETALNSRCCTEARLSSRTIHRSFCEAVSNGESPTMNLIWRSFREDCDELREEFNEMMDKEEAEEGEDRELKAEASSLEEGMDAGEDVVTKEDTAAEEDMAAGEEIYWERYLYHMLGNKEYVVRGKGVSGDSGIIDDDATGTPAADSPITVDIALTAQPLKSLAAVHTQAVSSGCSFSLMADIISDSRNGSVMVIRKPYRSSGGDGPEVKVYLNGNGVCHCYKGN